MWCIPRLCVKCLQREYEVCHFIDHNRNGRIKNCCNKLSSWPISVINTNVIFPTMPYPHLFLSLFAPCRADGIKYRTFCSSTSSILLSKQNIRNISFSVTQVFTICCFAFSTSVQHMLSTLVGIMPQFLHLHLKELEICNCCQQLASLFANRNFR